MKVENRTVKSNVLSIVALIVLSCSIVGLSRYSEHPDMESGAMTTSEGLRTAIASYDLSQGEKIHYEWESNSLVRFVITTDPYHPQLAEFVNLTDTRGRGSFLSPADAEYYVQVTFLDVPPGSEARIHYMSYIMTRFSELMVIRMPVILAGLTAALAGLLLRNWSNSKVRIQTEGEKESWTFWRFFVGDYKNWIAIVIGAVLLISYSILLSIDSNHLDQNYLVELSGSVGSMFVMWGLIFGLWISHNNYKVRK